jgi:hypothetical protein
VRYDRLIAGVPLGVTWRSPGSRGEQEIRRLRHAGPPAHLGAEGREPTRKSENTQPLGLRFRALLTEGAALRLELSRS